MHIVIATGVYPPDLGGPATYVARLAPGFVACGIPVIVCSFGTQTGEQENQGVRVFTVARQGGVLKRYYQFFRLLFHASRNADRIYAHDAVSVGLPAAFVCLIRRKVRLVLRLGGDFLWEKAYNAGWTQAPLATYYTKKKRMRERGLQYLMHFVLKRADQIIFSTDWQRSIYLFAYRLQKEKTTIIENCFPDVLIQAPFAAPLAPPRIIYAGRLVPLKNLIRVCTAIAQIPSVTLTIIGDGPDRVRLEEHVHNLGIVNRVTFLPRMTYEGLLKTIRNASFVIVPAMTEISPQTVNECVACGVPVIVTRETGIFEQYKNYLLFFDPASVADIRAAIIKLCDPIFYDHYRRTIQTFPINRTWQHVIEEHLSLFSRI